MSDCMECPVSETCNRNQDECRVELNSQNHVKTILGVMSGKGGVGKSSITALLSIALNKKGYKVGVLDADITGPSIPRLLGIKNKKAIVENEQFFPVITQSGIKVISLNLLVQHEEEPVIWRGPLLSNLVKQFWTNVLWEDLDYLVVDLPPGTSDVALTVLQTLPISGIVMVSVPQDFVSMIVTKTVHMARSLNVNILGVIENMSYLTCPDCGKKIAVFDGLPVEHFLQDLDLPLLGELPMLREISQIEKMDINHAYEPIKGLFDPILESILYRLEGFRK